MPSPEQDRRLTQERLEHRLGPTLQRLLGQVQDETGYPVLVGLAPNDIHGTYAHITYATNERPNHGIFVTAEAISFLDYLVAHECGHVLRLFRVPDSQRLLGFIDEEHVQRAAKVLVPQIQRRLGSIPDATAEKLATIYQRGVVGQVVNFPTDLRIETWIRNEYPDLRHTQRSCLQRNIAELELGLGPRVQAATPPFISSVEASLNAGYCTYVARLLGQRSLADAYRRRGLGPIGQELANQIWDSRFDGYRRDRKDTDHWAKRFGLRDWFSWRHYRSSQLPL